MPAVCDTCTVRSPAIRRQVFDEFVFDVAHGLYEGRGGAAGTAADAREHVEESALQHAVC